MIVPAVKIDSYSQLQRPQVYTHQYGSLFGSHSENETRRGVFQELKSLAGKVQFENVGAFWRPSPQPGAHNFRCIPRRHQVIRVCCLSRCAHAPTHRSTVSLILCNPPVDSFAIVSLARLGNQPQPAASSTQMSKQTGLKGFVALPLCVAEDSPFTRFLYFKKHVTNVESADPDIEVSVCVVSQG